MKTKFSEILNYLIETCTKSDGTQYTVEEIGVAIDYSGAYIRKLLNGQSKPGYDVVEKLAYFFDVDPNFLHGWKPKNIERDLKEIEDRIAFRKTSADVRPDIGIMLRKIADLIDGEQKHESNPGSESED